MTEHHTIDEDCAFVDDYCDELDEADINPPSTVTSSACLEWRLDPEISHSDWTIQITTKDDSGNPKNKEYHVHCCILTVGPRKSVYFESICNQASNFQEGMTRTSRIELDEIAAKEIPAMLDYMYDRDARKQLKTTTESATGLHFLSLYFNIASLRFDTMSFIKNDLSRRLCHIYYKHSCILHNKKVLGVVVDYCAKEFLMLKHPPATPIVGYAEPQFWIHVLRKYERSEQSSLHASWLLNHICQKNDLDLATFRSLTHEKYVPAIDPTVALDLLTMEAGLVNYSSLPKLTTLQDRCIKSLTHQYKSLLNNKASSALLEKQSPMFLSKLLIESLRSSSEIIDSNSTIIASFKRDISAKAMEIKKLKTSFAQFGEGLVKMHEHCRNVSGMSSSYGGDIKRYFSKSIECEVEKLTKLYDEMFAVELIASHQLKIGILACYKHSELAMSDTMNTGVHVVNAKLHSSMSHRYTLRPSPPRPFTTRPHSSSPSFRHLSFITMASRPTSYSIAVSALISLHSQNFFSMYEHIDYDPTSVDAFLQQILIEQKQLTSIHGPSLYTLLHSMQESVGYEITKFFITWLEAAASSVDALMDLMQSIQQAVTGQVLPLDVSSTSFSGMYLRAVSLGFEELSFDSVGSLWSDFVKQIDYVKQHGLNADEPELPLSSWTLSPSQMEESLQQEIRTLSLHKTDNIEDRDSQLQSILEHCPVLPSGHFLKFFYSLQNGDRQAAIDALQEYIDMALVQFEENSNSSSTTSDTEHTSILQFAAILAAAFWNANGDRNMSLVATEEAVRVAQQGGDAACVAFALGWLGLHDESLGQDGNTLAPRSLLHRCVERATQNNLRSLNAGASLILATQNTNQPAVAWSHWMQALVDNSTATSISTGSDRAMSMNHLESGDDALAILARQRLVAAGLWDAFGQANMSNMSSRAVLECHANHLMSDDVAAAVQNIARCSLLGFSSNDVTSDLQKSLQGHLEEPMGATTDDSACVYAVALRKMNKYSDMFKLPKKGAFQLETMLLLHEWAVRRGELSEAEDLGIAMQCQLCPRIPNVEEIKIDIMAQRALLLSRQEKWEEAKSLTSSLLEQCKNERRHVRHARLLLQLTAIHLDSASDQFAGALPYLLECLSISESNMNGVHACALSLLSQVHLRMHKPKRALAIVRAALSPILQHEHVFTQGETFMTIAECHLQIAKEDEAKSNDSLLAGTRMFKQAIECFKRCQDCSRLKNAYFLLASTYDLMREHQKERDEAAEEFVKLTRYIVHADSFKDYSALSCMDNTEALEQLLSRTLPVA
ncbi:hypothetical protein MPSEU_000864800 [Mayamaea pseudoterrestris]|nr:hypothetical protein MPSEU_000864800 [Mayamaea pseudoterrestris]